MKIEYSKEWCMRMAKREEVESALEIAAEGKGAGLLGAYPMAAQVLADEVRRLRYQVARTCCAAFRADWTATRSCTWRAMRRLTLPITGPKGPVDWLVGRLVVKHEGLSMTKLLNRAEALHLNTGMHWREAERLALSEIGVGDAAIVELVGECATLGTESLLTGDEICDFARAVLVHGSALQVALTEGDQADMRQLLRMAEKVRAWMGDGCSPEETPKPQIAALTEWAGSVASGMLKAP
jgi:hypothetical protein